ncbi:MAG: hypothetical protein FD157_4167, partial [Rhodocyclaceae bacterium]
QFRCQFDRIGKKFALVESGQAMLRAAEIILNRIDELQRELEDLREMKSGTLCSGASIE